MKRKALEITSPPGKKLEIHVEYRKDSLRKVVPYWYSHNTHAKGRWLGKTLFEVFSTEFVDKSPEYYRYAIESGKITVNDSRVFPKYILRNADLITHTVHRHEPPVLNVDINIIHSDDDVVVVNKPSSIPVHSTAINRIDRLTSGIVLLARNKEAAKRYTGQLADREVEKVYLCKVLGKFPDDLIKCNEPILTSSAKLAINMVSPDGKPSETFFKKLWCDSESSIVECRPKTGRTHQIRVHLQFLGYPIINDSIYCSREFFGEGLGKGGVENPEEVLQKIKAAAISTFEGEDYDVQIPDLADISKEEILESTSKDVECHECTKYRPDPLAEKMQIFLHSWKYSGPNWHYETSIPDWAEKDKWE